MLLRRILIAVTTEPQALHLQPCPACGRDVSPQAKNCPQCGHPGPAMRMDPRKQVILGRALLACTVVFLTAAFFLPSYFGALGTIGLIPNVLAVVTLIVSVRRERAAIIGGRVVIGLLGLFLLAAVTS